MIIMGLFCEVCNVEVQSESTMRAHINGKKHKRLASEYDRQKKNADHSVFVRDFEVTTPKSELQEYFSKFGKIDSLYLEPEKHLFLIVRYVDKETILKVLQVPHHFGGRKLSVKPKEIKTWQKKKKAVTPPTPKDTAKLIDHASLLTKLNGCESMEQQMDLLHKELALSWDDMCLRKKIQEDLQSIFAPLFPHCLVHQFGSSVNGFGILGCDMDIFIDLMLDTTPGELSPEACSLPYIANNKSIPRTDDGISYRDLGELPLEDRVKLVAKVLSHAKGKITQIVSIPSARCPVIKCVHSATGMQCDITINNQLALRNTNLLRLYSTMDWRIRPLLFSIRYWANVKEIAGNLNCGPRLTNYALTLVVLHYLQSIEPAVLQKIEQLVELSDSKTILDGWDCSYVEDQEKIPPSSNTQGLTELFLGLLQHFATFDFSNKVIMTRHAKATDLTSFRKYMDVNPQAANFKINVVCVQDPFVLDHNITANVNEKTKLKIMWEFTQAVQKIDDKRFSRTSAEANWGLAFLLSEDSVSVGPKQLELISGGRDRPCSGAAALARPTKYSFCITMQSAKLPSTFLGACADVVDMKEAWGLKMYAFTCRVLKELLSFDVVEENTGSNGGGDGDGDGDGDNDNNKDVVPEANTDEPAAGEGSPEGDESRADGAEGDSLSNAATVCCSNLPEDHTLPRNVVEEPLSEMRLESLSHGNVHASSAKRHPSGSSDNGEEATKRHKVDTGETVTLEDRGRAGDTVPTEQMDTDRGVGSGCPDTEQADAPSRGETDTPALALSAAAAPSEGAPCSEDRREIGAVRAASRHRLWFNRKRFQKQARHGEGTGYGTERHVTELMLADQRPGAPAASEIRFAVVFARQFTPVHTAVTVNFYPAPNQKEFSCFYTFFKSFLFKLIDKSLVECLE